MRVGVPREIKPLEGRVGLVPEAAGELVRAGHEVWLETAAGVASGFADDDYRALGVGIVADAADLYRRAELVVKVKEPVDGELELLRADHLLFCFLHLAAIPQLAARLAAMGLTAIGFETVAEAGELPILAPMSDIAGRIAVQVGTTLLHRPQGGKGLLLGGLPAAERGSVVVLGAGHAGGNAAALAAGLGTNVTVFDHRRDRLAQMRALGNNVTGLYPYADAMHEAVVRADLLVGAVLLPGARTPHLVAAETVRQMTAGSVIVDVSVDQGGCVETIRPTTYTQPSYDWEGVIHFGVTNMPGAVPKSASRALSAALIPYVLKLAGGRWRDDTALRGGINVSAGEIVHPALR